MKPAPNTKGKKTTPAQERGERISQSLDLAGMQGAKPPNPASVSSALKGIHHVLVGGFAIVVHTKKPRATQDVDVVVGDVHLAEAAIAKAFANLRKMKNPGEDVTRYAAKDGTEVINLLHPVGHFKVALEHTLPVKMGKISVLVNTFEASLVSKFMSMKSPHRSRGGRVRDEGDLIAMIESKPDAKGAINWKTIIGILREHPLESAVLDLYEHDLRVFVQEVRSDHLKRMKSINKIWASGKTILSL